MTFCSVDFSGDHLERSLRRVAVIWLSHKTGNDLVIKHRTHSHD